MIFNMVGGGGAGGASIFIVNSVNERPTNVFNNTLWVNTDIDVVKYVFSDNEPSNPTEGMLWLTISNSDNINVAAPINKDWMKFNLGIVRQYISGAWERKLAQLYKDGIWVDVSKIFVAYIDITYPANSTCTVTNSIGQVVASNANSTSSEKTFTATVSATGTYTVTATATDGSGNTKSQSVSITAEGQSVSVELSYGFYIFKEGEGLLNGYTVEKFQGDAASEYSFNNNRILWANNNAVGNILTFSPKTDCTEYKKIGFEFKCTSRYDSNYSVTIGVGSNKPSGENKPGTFVASVSDIYSTERKKYFVDLSSVNTSNYVKFAAFAVTGELYNVWFE